GVHPARRTPPGAVIWACADTWPLVGKLLWKEKIRAYLPSNQIKKILWHNRAEETPHEIQLVNGNTIELKSYDQGRNAFQGRPIHAKYGDEQCKNDSEGIEIEIQARLMDFNGFTADSMTPIRPQPWLEERIQEARPNDEAFYANLNDNRKSRGGYIDDEEIDLLIAEWPEEVQETRIKGYFASFMGAVYKSFNRKHHVCKTFDIPKEWPRYRVIDWGFNNPLACLWMALSPDRIWYVYNEHYKAQQLLAYHAGQIKKISGKERYRVTWADHDSQDRYEFAALGIKTMPAKKDIRLGVEAVQAALKVQGNGKARLRIMEHCNHTRKEMSSYRWAEGTEVRDAKDEPLKLGDHCPDCLRYVIFGVEHKGFFSKVL
ncbi:hypothetical protein LCGC14_2180730, partial [marine sediment metagenome]